MKSPLGPLAAIASLGLLAAAGALILQVLGTGAPVVRGAAAGLILGWGGSALEARFVLPLIRKEFNRALRIVTLGFGVRALAILGGLILLDRTGLASGSAFAAGVVGGFFAYFPLLARGVHGLPRNGEAQG